MEIAVENPAPTIIRLFDLVSPEFAQELMDLVDERGKSSEYNGNPNTKELRLGAYMQTGFMGAGVADPKEMQAVSALQSIVQPLIPIIESSYQNTILERVTGHRGFWIMRYEEGGGFTEHVDWSLDQDDNSTPAVATLCINLNDAYEGGQKYIAGQPIDCPKFGGEVHDGWTYHKVDPIAKGARYLVCTHFLGTLKT